MAEVVQNFRATSGRVTGVLGLAVCALVAVLSVATEAPPAAVPSVLGCALAAVVVWAALLRPRVSATAQDLLMKTFAEDITIPLASIDMVAVRRYLLVRSGGEKYICPAVGRSLRQTAKTEMRWQGHAQLLAPGLQEGDLPASVQTEVKGDKSVDYADFVETQIVHLADVDRAARGIEARSEEEYELGSQVVRRRAWPEIIAMTVLAVAFVVVLVVL